MFILLIVLGYIFISLVIGFFVNRYVLYDHEEETIMVGISCIMWPMTLVVIIFVSLAMGFAKIIKFLDKNVK